VETSVIADEMPLAPVKPDDKVALWAEVKRRRAAGAFVSAAPILDRLCAAFPDDPRFFLCSAEALIEAGRPGDAAARLRRAIQLSPQDERAQKLLAGLPAPTAPVAPAAAPSEDGAEALMRRLQKLAAKGRPAEVISTYHAALRQSADTVSRIEDWLELVNGAGETIYRAEAASPSGFVQGIVEEVRERGIAIRSFESVFGEGALLEDLIAIVRTTQDWYVPGKGHFIKALREAPVVTAHDNAVMRSALHPGLLGAANAFYGLFSRLVSANIVRTVAKADDGRVRQSSEGWHRDPEDSPMFKSFIYLNDVEEIGHGPFQYVPDSRRGGRYEYILSRFGRGVYDRKYKTRPDAEQMDREVREEDIVTVTGKAGTMFFCDTSGFHRGGYCITQDRYMVANVYQRPASQFPSYVLTDTDLDAAPVAVRMALGQAG
jgi:hypothetical protein